MPDDPYLAEAQRRGIGGGAPAADPYLAEAAKRGIGATAVAEPISTPNLDRFQPDQIEPQMSPSQMGVALGDYSAFARPHTRHDPAEDAQFQADLAAMPDPSKMSPEDRERRRVELDDEVSARRMEEAGPLGRIAGLFPQRQPRSVDQMLANSLQLAVAPGALVSPAGAPLTLATTVGPKPIRDASDYAMGKLDEYVGQPIYEATGSEALRMAGNLGTGAAAGIGAVKAAGVGAKAAGAVGRAASPFKRVPVPEGGLPAVRGPASPGVSLDARPSPGAMPEPLQPMQSDVAGSVARSTGRNTAQDATPVRAAADVPPSHRTAFVPDRTPEGAARAVNSAASTRLQIVARRAGFKDVAEAREALLRDETAIQTFREADAQAILATDPMATPVAETRVPIHRTTRPVALEPTRGPDPPPLPPSEPLPPPRQPIRPPLRPPEPAPPMDRGPTPETQGSRRTALEQYTLLDEQTRPERGPAVQPKPQGPQPRRLDYTPDPRPPNVPAPSRAAPEAASAATGGDQGAPKTVRLYRVEPNPEVLAASDNGAWLKKHMKADEFAKFESERGRLFADDPSAIEPYGHDPKNPGNATGKGMTTYYVDVPESVARGIMRRHESGFNEYVVPPEYVAGKKPLSSIDPSTVKLPEEIVKEQPRSAGQAGQAGQAARPASEPVPAAPETPPRAAAEAPVVAPPGEPPLVARMREDPNAWREQSPTIAAERAAAVNWANARAKAEGQKVLFGRDAVERAIGKQEPREGPTLGGGFGGLQKVFEDPKPKPFSTDPATQAAYEAVAGRVNRNPETRTAGERISEGGKRVYDRFVRQEGALERFEKKVEGRTSETGPTAFAKESQGAAPRRQHNLETTGVLEGQPDLPDPIAKAMSEIPQNEMNHFADYLTAKRYATKYDPKGFETGTEAAQNKAVVNEVETNPAKAPLVRAAKAFHEYDRTLLRNLAEADRWTPERLKAIEDGNPFYSQILREIEGSKGAAVTSGPMKQQGLKPVTGGTQPTRDALLLTRERGQRMIAAADKARLKHRILDTVEANKSKAAAAGMEEIPKDTAKRYVPEYDEIVAALRDGQKGTATPEQVNTFVRHYLEATRGDIVTAVRGGELKVYRVTDPLLSEYLRGEVSPDSWGWKAYEAVAKQASKVTSIQRLGTTAGRPAYAPFGLIRDVKTYLYQTEASPPRAVVNLVRGMYHAVRGTAAEVAPGMFKDTGWSRLYKRLSAEGLVGGDQVQARAALTRYGKRGVAESAKHYVRHPFVLVGDGAGKIVRGTRHTIGTLEAGPRIAETINASKRLGVKPDLPMTTEQRVALSNRASEITVNFRLGGRVSKQWNRFEVFVNSRIQGMEQARRSWTQKPLKMAAKTLAYSVIPEVALWAWVNSDDEKKAAYKRLPAWRRATMLNFPYENDDGGVSFWSIPSVPEFDAPGKIVRTMLDYFSEDDPKAAMAAVKEIVRNMAPVDGADEIDLLAPSVVQPLVNVRRDHSDFTDRSINPSDMKGVKQFAPEEVGHAGTSGTAKFLSGALSKVGLKLTAAETDHLIGGYLGPVAKDVARFTVSPKEKAEIPVAGRFFPRESESAVVDRFYKMADLASARRTSFLRLAERGSEKTESVVTPPQVGSVLGKIREALSALRESYDEAKDGKERRQIAREMDELAEAGIEVASPWQDEPAPAGAR